MSTTIGLKLDALDVLFFRDGRPFAPASRGKSELPMPQTFAGAIWTALLEKHGCDFGQLANSLKTSPNMTEAIRAADGPAWVGNIRVRGPWLAWEPKGKLEVLLSVPAVLHVEKGKEDYENAPLHLLQPFRLRSSRGLPGWQPSEPGMRPVWLKHREPTEAKSGYLTPHGFQVFLADGKGLKSGDVIKPGDLYDFDHRTGIGIDPDRLSAQESLIYGASFLALKPGVSLYAEVVLPDGAGRDVFAGIETLAFGGEGRRVRRTVLDKPFAWSELEKTTGDPKHKPFVFLTTPGIFDARWKPAALNGHLVAAAVPGAAAVSGWDLARGGPKPTRFAAMAGSVYFLDHDLNTWPDALSDNALDQQQGWGCYLKGVWTDE